MNPEDRAGIAELVMIAQRELPRRTRAYEQLVEMIYLDIRRLAYAIVGNMDDAEQVTQDSLLRVYHKLRTLNDPMAFQKWMTTIVTNTARSFLAREVRERDKARLLGTEPTETFEPASDMPSFDDLVRNLDTTERAIIAMRFVQDLEFNDIATITGLGLSATKMRYYRALEKLNRANQSTARTNK